MMRRPVHTTKRSGAAGFTLVELLVVIAIIGLIIALVLVAAADGVRRAEERATQSLITKLEQGLADRLDALLNAQAPINQTHRYLAAITFPFNNTTNYVPVGKVSSSGSDERRAQVIAQFDYIRAELPDVFFLNAKTSDGTDYAASYPLNFGGSAYPLPKGFANTIYDPYYLPLGNAAPGLPYYDPPSKPFDITDTSTWVLTTNPTQSIQTLYGAQTTFAGNFSLMSPPHSGIFGASFSAIGGITKNLGYAPIGYNGVDDNSDGAIDDLAEGTPTGMTTADFRTQVNAQLARHTHKTARAEMLYAVLVEGVGPLGSVFNRDEFTAREVQDTDGDGLPEFVDAWGEPLQFFRWPIYFGVDAAISGNNPLATANPNEASVRLGSDSQKGPNHYKGYTERRDLNQLDPNQLLVSPGWWWYDSSSTPNRGNVSFATSTTAMPSFSPPNGTTTSGSVSQGAMAFMRNFQSLIDPYALDTSTGTSWDRTGNYSRRAYFSKSLVLSAGPDKEPGVGQFGKDYASLSGEAFSSDYASSANFPDSAHTMDENSTRLVLIEGQGAQSNPYLRTGSFFEGPQAAGSISNVATTTEYLQNVFGLDDISNHNIQAPTTGVR